MKAWLMEKCADPDPDAILDFQSNLDLKESELFHIVKFHFRLNSRFLE